jgi:hypothetical protein
MVLDDMVASELLSEEEEEYAYVCNAMSKRANER